MLKRSKWQWCAGVTNYFLGLIPWETFYVSSNLPHWTTERKEAFLWYDLAAIQDMPGDKEHELPPKPWFCTRRWFADFVGVRTEGFEQEETRSALRRLHQAVSVRLNLLGHLVRGRFRHRRSAHT